MSDDPALRFFPDEYLPNAERASVTYAKWRQQQPGEYAKWIAFRDAVLRGEQIAPPALSTRKGRELIAAGEMHMSVSRLVGQVQNPNPPPPGPSPTPPPPPPPPPSSGRLWADSSPWYALQGSSPSVDPASAFWMARIKSMVTLIGVKTSHYTCAVYTATTPRRRWRSTAESLQWYMEDVPTPVWNWRTTTNATEFYTSIIDIERGAVWDHYWSGGLTGYPGSATSLWTQTGGMNYRTGAVYRIGGSGCWNVNYTANGVGGPWASPSSQLCFLGGLALRTEFVAGSVPHALLISMPNDVVSSSYRAPATASDGQSVLSTPMPMGSRICVRPEVNVDGLAFLNAGQKILAKAMQTYGAYIGLMQGPTTSGGAANLHCQSWQEGDGYDGTNPYAGYFDTGTQAQNFAQIWDYCHVLSPPASVDYDNRGVWSPENPHV